MAKNTQQQTTPVKKNTMGKAITLGGDRFWQRVYEGKQVIVRCCDYLVFDLATGMGVGSWDESKATVI
jgi:hypothetical protein